MFVISTRVPLFTLSIFCYCIQTQNSFVFTQVECTLP